MVTVHKVPAGAAGPYARYLVGPAAPGDRDRGDYYLSDEGPRDSDGRWLLDDRAASLLGVDPEAPVSVEQLRNLLAVRFPDDPDRKLRPVGGNRRAVAAIDLTFSAPKSVSIVWALGSPETRRAIEAAHERAVDRALAHAVEHVQMVRRRVDRETVRAERADELIASAYMHTTARAVAGRRPDPQLHSHVLLHGALRADSDRVVAIESRAVMVHQREIGACYRAEFADRIRDLGYAIERQTGRDGRFFEIAGVPREVIEQFSSRHHQVRQRITWRRAEHLHGLRALSSLDGEIGAEARRRLTVLEREHAVGERSSWDYLRRTEGLHRLARREGEIGDRARAALAEIDRWGNALTPAEERVIAKESRTTKGSSPAVDLDDVWERDAAVSGFDAITVERLRLTERERPPSSEELAQQVLRALTAHKATFADREARAIALEAAGSNRDVTGLLDDLHRRGDLIALEDGRFTTAPQREVERETIQVAERLAAGRVAPTRNTFVDDEVDRLRGEFGGREGLAPEQEAAVRAACSERQLVVIEGQAGTGKSTALIAAARAEQRGGRNVIVTSTGGQAAARLASELRTAGVTADGYSTRALHVGVERGRITLDPSTTVIHDEATLAATTEQRFLFAACLDAGARLIEVGDRDQNNPVGAGGLMGHIERFAAERAAHVRLQEIVRARDPDDRHMQRALRAGETARAVANLDDRDRIVIAATRTEAVQRAAELWDRLRREPGGALVVCESSNEHVDELNAQLQAMRAEAGELGREQAQVPGRPYALRAGDEIVIRAQFRDLAVGVVRNGERGIVTAIEDERVRIALGDERSVQLDDSKLRDADVRLAYAQHSNPAQGITTGHAIDLVTRLSTRRGQYVALTRGRDSHNLITSYDDLGVEIAAGRTVALETLANRLARDEPEAPSIDVAALPTTSDALRSIAKALGEERAEQVAGRAKDLRDDLSRIPTDELASRSDHLSTCLAAIVIGERAGQQEAESADRARRLVADAQERLDAQTAEYEQTSRLRRQERARRAAIVERMRETVERQRANLTAPEPNAPEPSERHRWSARQRDELAHMVASTAELARRHADREGRAVVQTDLAPRRDVIGLLGERPGTRAERELWEGQAASLEISRNADGRLPATMRDGRPGRGRRLRERSERERDYRPADGVVDIDP